MDQYKVQKEVITELVTYLKSKPFEDVEKIIPAVSSASQQEEPILSASDLVATLNYMVNKPYFEVYKIVNKVIELKPIQKEEIKSDL